jgi:DNA-binding MurR/RpiR family transcriptional regulator
MSKDLKKARENIEKLKLDDSEKLILFATVKQAAETLHYSEPTISRYRKKILKSIKYG